MSNPHIEAPVRRPSIHLIGAAAAAVLVVALGAFAVMRDDGTESSTMHLALAGSEPGATSMTSCIAFSADLLADMDTAFDGTVTSTSGGAVTLAVSRWYKGGDADAVELAVPGGGAGSTVSLDGVEFIDGERYLVSATDGSVNLCGFSGPWTAELEAAFVQAFSG